MLRIGLNARGFSSSGLRGFNRHASGLIGAMRALEKDLQFHLFTDRPLSPAHAETLRDCPVHFSTARPHLLWEQWIYPRQAARAGMHILHSPLNIGLPKLRLGRAAHVLTLHDLYMDRDFKRVPSWTDGGAWKGWMSYKTSWWAARGADAVITVSRYSRDQILKSFPEWAAKIHVIHNGVENRFSPGRADPEVLKRRGLQQPYAFYIGGFDERKNVGLLAEAYRLLARDGRPRPLLALAGDSETVPEKLRQAFSGLTEVRWLGFLPDEELPHLYRGAQCTLVPSNEEGFGFPLAEAMACGSPVLASEAASLPEVGGEAAAYFPPRDPQTLARLLQRSMEDRPWLEGLKADGLKRSAQFTWDSAARKTLTLYRDLAEDPRLI